MAAQETGKEEAEFNLVPERPETPLSLPTATSAITAPPPRRLSSSETPARPPIRTSHAPGDVSQPPAEKREVNRCSSCRKRVGLTGFRCRCGDLFCSEHRYSDRHVCGYDYKSAGREAIARENPPVKAAKIIRI